MSIKKKGPTKAQMDRLAENLVRRRHRLQDEIRGALDGGDVDGSDRSGDEADLANLSIRSDIAVDVRARESRELQMIDNALHKISEGVYGTCEDCSEAISVQRLEALPFAQYCIDCQERYEVDGSNVERREFQVLD